MYHFYRMQNGEQDINPNHFRFIMDGSLRVEDVPHPWRTIGHSGDCETDRLGAFVQKAADVGCRHMSLDHVTVHEPSVTGDHALRHSVVEFEAHEKAAEHVLAYWCEAVLLKMIHPGQTATASIGLADVYWGCLREGLRRR